MTLVVELDLVIVVQPDDSQVLALAVQLAEIFPGCSAILRVPFKVLLEH